MPRRPDAGRAVGPTGPGGPKWGGPKWGGPKWRTAWRVSADKLNALTESEQETAVGRFMAGPRPAARNADQAVRTILDRLDRHEQRTSDTIGEILSRIDVLGRELTELAEEAAQPAAQGEPAHAALELALRNIVDHLEVSERRNRDALRAIQLRLNELSQRAAADEPTVGPALAALESRLFDIASRLSDVERDNLAGRTEQVAMTVAQREVRALERKLDAVARQAEAAERAAAAPPGIARLDAEVESLNQRFDDIKAETASDRDLRLLGQTVDQLVAQLGEPGGRRPDMELGPGLAELERRIDTVDLGLRQALEQQHLLQEAIHGLGAAEPPPGPVLEAIHRQMSHFNERVAAVEGRIGHLATLENAMGQLYRALEGGRAEMSAVAENVAARVAHGVFAQYGAGGVGAASPELRALEDGLAAVRATSAQADQRSQETLAAVHETLEQIIAKLSELEARGPAPETVSPPGAAAMQFQAETAYVDAGDRGDPLRHLAAGSAGPSRRRSARPSRRRRCRTSACRRLKLVAAAGARQLFRAGLRRCRRGRAPVGEAQAAAMRHDFIAAARRAAMAAQPSVGGRRNRAEDAPGLLSRFRRKRTSAGEAAIPDAAAPVRSMRRRLLMAGLVLLAVVSAVAVGSRELAPGKPMPSAASPAAGPEGTPVLTMDPLPAAPKLPEPEHPLSAPAGPPPTRCWTGLPRPPWRDRRSRPWPLRRRPSAGHRPGSPQPCGRPRALATGSPSSWWEANFSTVVRREGMRPRPPAGSNAPPPRGLPRRNTASRRSTNAAAVSDAIPTPPPAIRTGGATGQYPRDADLAVLMTGSSGHQVDMATAARWFREAALQGLKDSQFNLAILYERGLGGVARNAAEAAYWYAVAAAQGDSDARTRVEVLRATLSRRDSDAATRRAAAFQPRPQRHDANVVSVLRIPTGPPN